MAFRYLLFCVTVLKLCLTLILCQDDCSDFTTQPQDVVARAGTMDFMECVYMDPNLAVFWEKDGTSIGGLDDQSCDCQVTSDGTLEFNDISAEETGEYFCSVLIALGVSRSCPAYLRLAESPVFNEKMGPGNVGSTTRQLSAVVSGDPLPQIEWIFNEQVISESDSYTIMSEMLENGGISRRDTLIINNIQPEHRGVYTLRATNTAGTVDENWTVPVLFGNVHISNVVTTSTEIQLTCTGEYYTEGDNRITWKRREEPILQTGQIIRTDETYQIVFETQLHIDEASCTGAEIIDCTLTYEGAMFEQQNTASQTICDDDDECLLPNIMLIGVSCTALTLEVEGIPGPYIIGYLAQESSTWTDISITLLSSSQEFTFPGLLENTQYDIRITCPSSNSIPGPFVTYTTNSKPPPVTGLYVDVIYNSTGTFATLTWESSTAGDVMSYIITWYTSDNQDQTYSVETPTSITQYDWSIVCDVAYVFRIAATNLCGTGSNSAPVERMCSTVPPAQRVDIRQLTPQTIDSDTAALLIHFSINYLDLVNKVRVDVLEQNDNFATVQTLNYTIDESVYKTGIVCVGGLTPDLHYLVCLSVTYNDIGDIISCVRQGKDEGIEDDNTQETCQPPFQSKYIDDNDESTEASTIPDWGIAVIVVGAILLVAFIFCFLGLCFACQTSQSKNVTFGSMSSINTERGGNVVPTNMHMHNPRTMSPTRSCLKYHRGHGHSTTWNDHVDTLRQMETDKGTHV